MDAWEYTIDQERQELIAFETHLLSGQPEECDCQEKHLLHLAKLASEGVQLAPTAELRMEQQKLADDIRKWRKDLGLVEVCEVSEHESEGNPDGNPAELDRCVAHVQEKIDAGELPKGSNPWAICKASIVRAKSYPESVKAVLDVELYQVRINELIDQGYSFENILEEIKKELNYHMDRHPEDRVIEAIYLDSIVPHGTLRY